LSNSSKSERIHALDSLRAIMMMLGLVIHSAITYGVIDYSGSWPIKDALATSPLMDWLVSLIHAFRMPLFFIVAGFFAALLFYKRGPGKMAKNRLDRILYPFLVFIVILWPLVQFGFGYSGRAFNGDSRALPDTLASFGEFSAFIPRLTMHLWFLYYLFLITLASFGIGLLLKKLPRVSKSITWMFNPLFRYPFFKLLVFSALTFVLLLFMDRTWVATSLSFTPDLNTFVFYAYFYLFGWVLFTSRQPLEQLKRFDWLFTVLGTVLLTVKFNYAGVFGREVVMAINALIVWMFSFGITGLFIRYASNHSHAMRYVSDASYWFYLIHLPLTALLPGLIAGWNLSPVTKFLVVLAVSFLICWVTYHYLVRDTFVGKFLNGKRYSTKGSLKRLVSLDRTIKNAS
jgi:peptidoglycan/LPS O-acetylase OafA/YrhL